MATKTKKNHRNVVYVGECITWENEDAEGYHTRVGIVAAVNDDIIRVRGVCDSCSDQGTKLKVMAFSIHNETVTVISKKEYADFVRG